MRSQNILPHEPDEELLSVEDALQDAATLDRLLAEQKMKHLLQTASSEHSTWNLVEEIIDAGICKDEKEVIARAVKTFFVAVLPDAKWQIAR